MIEPASRALGVLAPIRVAGRRCDCTELQDSDLTADPLDLQLSGRRGVGTGPPVSRDGLLDWVLPLERPGRAFWFLRKGQSLGRGSLCALARPGRAFSMGRRLCALERPGRAFSM
jgi:hypothetical protein